MLTAVELIFQEIEDPVIRENFKRLSDFLTQNTPLRTFKFFEIDIPTPQTNVAVAHGLPYVPLDIVVISAIGNQKYYFLNQFFNAANLYITTSGPVRLRFLAGRYTDPGYEKAPVNYVFTPPF